MTAGMTMFSSLHDAQVAMEVAKRAEMGWFDVEFTMYGCAYLEQDNRYYRLSAEDEKIYDFIEKGAHRDILPTDIMVLTQKCPVPIGMREEIALDVKRELAKQLAEKYPKEFFSYIEQIATEATEDTARETLDAYCEKLTGSFDARGLRRFQELLDTVYLNRKITREHYKQYASWMAEEYKNMEEVVICKDIFEKNLYGIAYQSGENVKYIVNACKGYVYKKKYELEGRNIFTTPIFSETYYYNYTLRLPQAQQQFAIDMQQYISAEYIRTVQNICVRNNRLSKEQFMQYLNETEKAFGDDARKTLQHYGYRWGILW